MAKKNIGATLSLNQGNFFVNIKKATSELSGLERSTTNATGKLSKLGGVAASAGKGFLTASAVGITAMTGLTVKALSMAGELEQNIGGSEAVFKNFAGTLQNVGENAFETMGLSMSDFLGTANKMGALFQGSGFTIAESADLTTNAMQRAADVASIMGVDINAAMEAVAGAAKGNFTMMDNLGVAINDTSIKAYAAANGIKTIGKTMSTQEKIGIAMKMFLEKSAYAAGNYAKENETLTGSLNTAKAAFATFMSGKGSAEGISKAFINVASVVSKKVSELLPSLTTGLSQVIKQLAPKIPELLKSAMPGITTGAMALVSGLTDIIPSLISVIAEALPTVLPMLVSGFTGVITKLASAITTNAPALLSGIGEGIKSALAGTDLSGVGEILGGVFSGLSSALSGVLNTATTVYNFFANNWGWISPIIAGITASVIAWKIAMGTANAVQTIAIALNKKQKAEIVAMTFSQQLQAIMTGVQTAATTAFNTVQGIMNALFVASPIGWIILAIGALVAIGIALWMNWDSVCKWIGGVWEGIKTVAVNVWNGISDFFVAWWPYIFAVFTGGISLIVGFVINNWDTIKNTTIAVFNAVKDTVINIWNGIWNGIKGIINLIIGGINGLIKGFVNGINGLINGVNTVTGAIGIPAIPTFTAPQIPMLAKGGDIVTSGRVLVGEKGPEYLDLPKGARVTPLGKESDADSNGAFNVLAGMKNVLTDACVSTTAVVKDFVKDIAENFNRLNAEPAQLSELLTPVVDSMLRRIDAVIAKPIPVPDLSKLAMEGITRPSQTVADDKPPKAPEPKTEPNPPSEQGKSENKITIHIYADGKSSEEIVDDLMPKLKLALANL